MDLRSVQRPLKKKYRNEPGSSRITLEAKASQQDTPITLEQLENLRQKTVQYCVVFETLAKTPDLQTEWA